MLAKSWWIKIWLEWSWAQQTFSTKKVYRECRTRSKKKFKSWDKRVRKSRAKAKLQKSIRIWREGHNRTTKLSLKIRAKAFKRRNHSIDKRNVRKWLAREKIKNEKRVEGGDNEQLRDSFQK